MFGRSVATVDILGTKNEVLRVVNIIKRDSPVVVDTFNTNNIPVVWNPLERLVHHGAHHRVQGVEIEGLQLRKQTTHDFEADRRVQETNRRTNARIAGHNDVANAERINAARLAADFTVNESAFV